jgi:hypothetical protein
MDCLWRYCRGDPDWCYRSLDLGIVMNKTIGWVVGIGLLAFMLASVVIASLPAEEPELTGYDRMYAHLDDEGVYDYDQAELRRVADLMCTPAYGGHADEDYLWLYFDNQHDVSVAAFAIYNYCWEKNNNK